jgi:hypothetical protein
VHSELSIFAGNANPSLAATIARVGRSAWFVRRRSVSIRSSRCAANARTEMVRARDPAKRREKTSLPG